MLSFSGLPTCPIPQEKLYAVYSFIAQLVNSTAVLLLVSAGHSNIQGLDGGEAKSLPRWLRTFIMNGSYTDFTPGWYEDVGVSLMVSRRAARSMCLCM
jgi:hypothetical protein